MSVFSDQKQFMEACGQTTGQFNESQFSLYTNLIKEEFEELQDGVKLNDRVEILDALMDIIVVTVGAAHSLGVDVEGAWQEVVDNNNSKIDKETGKVRKREDGKILKPDGWQPPNFEQYVLKSVNFVDKE
jgi:predicted HAD superfamily Cof-like phosphohydrolase